MTINMFKIFLTVEIEFILDHIITVQIYIYINS